MDPTLWLSLRAPVPMLNLQTWITSNHIVPGYRDYLDLICNDLSNRRSASTKSYSHQNFTLKYSRFADLEEPAAVGQQGQRQELHEVQPNHETTIRKHLQV